ncbi:MAG TPA: hypothetical protein VK000_11015, partial [Luteimonas sp.]|nr:hypothetical protein [Luteimonas sp.]
MRQSALGLALLAALSATPVLAAPQQAPAADRIADLEVRLQALEAEVQALRAELAAAGAQAESPEPVIAEEADAADPFEALAAEPVEADLAADTAALAAPASAAPASSANAFNPAIMLVLNGSVSDDDGFSLGESELSFAANIDDKFFGQLTLAVGNEDGEDHVELEEAYIDTTSLPGGLAVRAGRFFSNIGYLNSRHAHTDSFFDRPLAYEAFLGEQYGDDGV